jgi:hypothetical protein
MDSQGQQMPQEAQPEQPQESWFGSLKKKMGLSGGKRKSRRSKRSKRSKRTRRTRR